MNYERLLFLSPLRWGASFRSADFAERLRFLQIERLIERQIDDPNATIFWSHPKSVGFQDEIDFARVRVHRGNAHLHLVAQAVDFAGYATF